MCVSTGYIPGWRFLTVDKILHSVELTLAPWCQVLLPTHCVLGEIPRLSHIWVVSKKWFFLGVFLAWIDGIVSFLFCCFNANEYWPPFLSSFYWFPVKLQDIMLNKCHKGHWVIIERVVSTVPLGVQGLCPTPISAVLKWPKGPLLADSTLYNVRILHCAPVWNICKTMAETKKEESVTVLINVHKAVHRCTLQKCSLSF